MLKGPETGNRINNRIDNQESAFVEYNPANRNKMSERITIAIVQRNFSGSRHLFSAGLNPS